MSPVKPLVALLVALVVLGLGACGGGGGKKPAARPPTAGHRVATGTFGSAPQERSAGFSPDYRPTGRIIADDGFRATHDGFSFSNYGGESGAVDLTPAALEELFGPDVCSTGVGSSCLLTPVAEHALEQFNGAMNAGHCYGFSVVALRLFKHIVDPTVFGASTVPALNIQGNDLLQTAIAEAFISQVFPRVVQARIVESPNQILNRLISALKAKVEVYTLGIYRDVYKNVGHAITPYAVENKGGGRFALLTYDNNHPLIRRAVMFDRKTNSWSYDAASNPSDPTWHFAGDASTMTMSIDPLTPGLGPQACFFCGSSNPTGAPEAPGSGRPKKALQQITLEGDPSNHSHLLITDPQGRRTGFVNGKLVSEIPGSKAIVPFADQVWRVAPEPIYQLPAGVPVKVAVAGARLARPVVENVSLVAPGASAVVKGIKVGPGQSASVTFGRGAASVQYHAGNLTGAAPIVQLGRETSGPDFSVSVHAPVLRGGSTLKVALDASGKRVMVATPKGAPATGYGLSLSKFTPLGKQGFAHGGLKLPPGSSSQLKFRGFTRAGQALPFATKSAGRSHTTKLSG